MNSFRKASEKKITFGKIKPQSISSGFRKFFNESGQLAAPIASVGLLTGQPELVALGGILKAGSTIGKYGQSKIEQSIPKKQYSTQENNMYR
jgi:hypothetical protein